MSKEGFLYFKLIFLENVNGSDSSEKYKVQPN